MFKNKVTLITVIISVIVILISFSISKCKCNKTKIPETTTVVKDSLITDTITVIKHDTLYKTTTRVVERVLELTDTLYLTKVKVVTDTLKIASEPYPIPVDYFNEDMAISGFLTDTAFVLTNLTINPRFVQETTYLKVRPRTDRVITSIDSEYLSEPIIETHLIKYPWFVNKAKYRERMK